MNDAEDADLRSLRERAEARLAAGADGAGSRDPRQAEAIIHELQVYREELLIQNDELRAIQVQLEQTRDEFAELYHHVPIGYLTLDEHATIRRANRTFAEMVGMDLGQLVGRSLSSLIEPESLAGFLIRFKAFRAAPEGKQLDLRLLGRGREVEVRMEGRHAPAALADRLGSGLFLVTLTDVSAERAQARAARAAQDAHRQSEARLAEALDAVNDGVWELDYASGSCFYSDTTFRMLGYEPVAREQGAEFIQSRIHPEDRREYDRVQERLRSCTAGKEQSLELRIRAADGQWRHILWRGRCMERNGDGSALRVIGVHTDLTERRRAEEEQARLQRELYQAQKMEALGQLAGGIAHDFNNILASILGFTELSRLRLGDGAEAVSGYLAEVDKAGHRARDLVRKMLLFSRTHEPAEREAVDVNAVVAEALEMLRPILPSSIELATDAADPLPRVVVAPVALQQVLTNLCVNARDAMEGKGRLELRTRLVQPDGRECSACSQKVIGSWLEVAVSDNGPGIQTDMLSRIFDPFYTTKAAGVGTGLGLAVVHGILRAHGGHVLVDSAPNAGTTFRLLFPPAADFSEPIREAPMHPSQRAGEDRRVMVIDDEPALRDYLRELLTIHGYQVSAYSDPTAALEHLLEHPREFDILLTDQTMPGMTGLELATRVRDLRPDLPLVLITGYSDEVDSRRGTGLPVDKLLPKPVGSDELLATLGDLLERAPAGTPAA